MPNMAAAVLRSELSLGPSTLFAAAIMDDADEQLTANFRRSAAALLASFDPHIAAAHIPPAFQDTLGPLHCPRCSRPCLTTRSISLRSKKTTGLGRRRAHAQNTTQAQRAPRAANKQAFLLRQCALCQYEDKRALSPSHGNNERISDGDSGCLPSQRVPDTPIKAQDAVLADGVLTKALLPEKDPPSAGKGSTVQATSASDCKDAFLLSPRDPDSLRSQRKGFVAKAKAEAGAPAFSNRAKKKAGLSAMLERSKQQQREKEKQAESSGSGLSAFLSAL